MAVTHLKLNKATSEDLKYPNRLYGNRLLQKNSI